MSQKVYFNWKKLSNYLGQKINISNLGSYKETLDNLT
jgi:hypothetical protein